MTDPEATTPPSSAKGRRALVWLGMVEESEPDNQPKPTRREKIVYWVTCVVGLVAASVVPDAISGSDAPWWVTVIGFVVAMQLASLMAVLSRRWPRGPASGGSAGKR